MMWDVPCLLYGEEEVNDGEKFSWFSGSLAMITYRAGGETLWFRCDVGDCAVVEYGPTCWKWRRLVLRSVVLCCRVPNER